MLVLLAISCPCPWLSSLGNQPWVLGSSLGCQLLELPLDSLVAFKCLVFQESSDAVSAFQPEAAFETVVVDSKFRRPMQRGEQNGAS